MLVWKRKPLPQTLTSYDVLKTLAIVLMVADHIGYFFYPDETWFRIFGRLCVPIWFFLIGYARSRDLSGMALFGAAVLALSAFVAGQTVFPLSILVTLMIGRYCIDVWMRAARRGGETLAGLFCMLAIFGFPLALLFEYGTIGLLFTVYGGLCRYRQDQAEPAPRLAFETKLFALASFTVFTIWQALPMASLSGVQLLVLAGGMAAVAVLLWHFYGRALPVIDAALPRVVSGTLKLTGRYTLEIYVLHLLLFRAVAVYALPERFAAGQGALFDPRVIEVVQFFLQGR